MVSCAREKRVNAKILMHKTKERERKEKVRVLMLLVNDQVVKLCQL